MTDPTPQQPRIEGVKYRKVRLFRNETTVIDGISSTRRVGYDGWEPVPPREWDELILKTVTGIAIGFTAIAVAGGTASLGGLLDPLVPSVVAYGMGSVFAIAWLYCLGIEWLNRTAPDRARPAKIAGWFFLLLSMGAVASYGHTLHQEWAGGFGAGVDLVAKGAWWLLLREYAVPLDAGVAHWVQDEEQRLAGRALLAGRVRRLNRRAAYHRAVGGAEFQAADAMLTRAEAARGLPEAPAEPAPEPVHVAEPAPAPAPAAPAPAAPPAPPAAPAEPPAAAPAPPAAAGGAAPTPPVTAITRQPIAAICRTEIAANAKVSDADLVDAVKKAGHPDRPNLPDTVRRTALRIDPNRKAS
ncbi:hypothetical protein RVR_4440 [Actinacidiphila reveromycinica]|uniref:Uncharacterized protein n=1 Tax=Actinacidiphila reveromycinica TaxID=659352 RepID=A0A7U3VP31_9ACTN|nr:hypothetical protein [Streptomyces sp. SN-593]BBA98307.1 hypothetical protein RVR_4440 [Streptomyces sp. SN-593]